MKLSLVAAAAIVASGTAFAADLPSRYAPAPAPVPMAPVFTWTGFYIGANAGYAMNNDKTSYNYSYLPGNGTGNFSDLFGNTADNVNGFDEAGPLNVSGANAVQSALLQGIIPSSLGSSDHGTFTGGGQIGYNWQTGGFVLGLEGDIDWLGRGSWSSFSQTVTYDDDAFYTNSGAARASVDWLSTARVRAGYAIDRTLLYVTGGLAFGGTNASSHSLGTDGDTPDTFSGSVSDTRVGWAAGGGLEYAFSDHWSGRVEGLYYDLGSVSYAVSPQDAGSAAEGVSVLAHHKFDGTLVRVGLNYKF